MGIMRTSKVSPEVARRPDVGRAIKAGIYGAAGLLALSACSSGGKTPDSAERPSPAISSPGASPLPSTNPSGRACYAQPIIMSQRLKQEILNHQAPRRFIEPLKNPHIKIIDFGIPINASAAETRTDHRVINDIHSFVTSAHPILVVPIRTATIPEGRLGIVLYSGHCPTASPSPSFSMGIT